jgi:hypothetical protein
MNEREMVKKANEWMLEIQNEACNALDGFVVTSIAVERFDWLKVHVDFEWQSLSFGGITGRVDKATGEIEWYYKTLDDKGESVDSEPCKTMIQALVGVIINQIAINQIDYEMVNMKW